MTDSDVSRVTVNRIASDNRATISTVSVDRRFVCFGLEDEHRAEKVPAETRIPQGPYNVRLRTVGGFHKRYCTRFPDIHRGMLHIVGVPNFDNVLIHVGNTDDDTAGCLLVGMGANARPGEMSVQSSVDAYRRFYRQVVASAERGRLQIEFIDSDRGQS